MLLTLALAGCGDADDGAEKARALVETTFAEQVKPGPFGTEAIGKGVWFRAPAIDGTCLQDKNWGHMDDAAHSASGGGGASRRISPRYEAQNTWTARTEKGWCVHLGADPKLEVTGANFDGGAWVVDYALTMGAPGGWWDCVDAKKRQGYVRVLVDDAGVASFEGAGADAVTLYQGGCPSPLPATTAERKGGSRPDGKAPQAPSKADAIAAAKRLDDALWDGDFEAALAATSCYNLYEKNPFGSCAPAEFLGLGPLPRGGAPRMSDGPPWSMNAFKSLDDFGDPKKDGADPTLFHVLVKEAKGKNPARSVAIQWVDGDWKIVAVLGRLSEGLATAQILYDLDRKEKRDIFEKRLKGEQIGEDGLPLDAGVRYGYVEPEAGG